MCSIQFNSSFNVFELNLRILIQVILNCIQFKLHHAFIQSMFSFKWNLIFTKSTFFFHHFTIINSVEKHKTYVDYQNHNMCLMIHIGVDCKLPFMTCIKLRVWLFMIFWMIRATKHFIYQINKNKDGRTMNDSGCNIALHLIVNF